MCTQMKNKGFKCIKGLMILLAFAWQRYQLLITSCQTIVLSALKVHSSKTSIIIFNAQYVCITCIYSPYREDNHDLIQITTEANQGKKVEKNWGQYYPVYWYVYTIKIKSNISHWIRIWHDKGGKVWVRRMEQ